MRSYVVYQTWNIIFSVLSLSLSTHTYVCVFISSQTYFGMWACSYDQGEVFLTYVSKGTKEREWFALSVSLLTIKHKNFYIVHVSQIFLCLDDLALELDLKTPN